MLFSPQPHKNVVSTKLVESGKTTDYKKEGGLTKYKIV